MAEQQVNALASAYPNPPTFYVHFTPENIERITSLRKEAGISSDTPNPPPLPNLPHDLRFLQPPEPPTEGVYRTFGDPHRLRDRLMTLADLEQPQLYPSPTSPILEPLTQQETLPHPQRALILKKLAKSLLLSFLELMGLLAQNPTANVDKISELRLLFINFYYLCNEYRPHQAREELKALMEEQVKKVREEREGVERMRDEVREVLKRLSEKEVSGLEEDGKAAAAEEEETEKFVEKKKEWEEIYREFGAPGEIATATES